MRNRGFYNFEFKIENPRYLKNIGTDFLKIFNFKKMGTGGDLLENIYKIIIKKDIFSNREFGKRIKKSNEIPENT